MRAPKALPPPPPPSAVDAAAAVWLVLALGACGGAPPPRWVIERDLGELAFRRYQRVGDVELAVAGNPAVGHTAVYVAESAAGAPALHVAFVTVYEQPGSLAAEVRDLVTDLATYAAAPVARDGHVVWSLEGVEGDRWLLWVSGRVAVKVGGGAGGVVPDALVAAYLDAYPSDLDAAGRARPGRASAGPSRREGALEAGDEAEDVTPLLREPRAAPPDAPAGEPPARPRRRSGDGAP